MAETEMTIGEKRKLIWQRPGYREMMSAIHTGKPSPKKGIKTGKPAWNSGKKGLQVSWCKGKSIPQITGENNYLWRGDKVGYGALHDWVNRHLGKPNSCDHCGKSGLKGRFIHRANKSHKYKRILTDWLRLCAKCHKKYDLGYKSIKNLVT